MGQFSLEEFSERIHFGKTKKYFQEVLSSYQNNNYRSSVVMLWSVAVCDIVYKLQNLVDMYADKIAQEILSELTTMQTDRPRSSEWEIKLVDDVFAKTNLINSAEYENLKYLQKQRHLCAHPILNHDRELETPNKETVRSLLRNTLEGLLIKPPFYTQGIFDELLDDISENKEALNTRTKVKQYIESRYLNRLTSNLELSMFRSLWKLVFKLQNEDCEKNRVINLQVLEVISNRNLALVKSTIEGEQDYYSNIASSGYALSFLIYYLARNPELYASLTEDAKLKIQHCIKTDDIGRCAGWFVKESLEQHYSDLITWIEGDDRPALIEGQSKFILEISDSVEWQELFCKIVGTYYACSKSYDQADTRFSNILQPQLYLFNLDALKFLLQKIEANSQAYGRGKASLDHPKIKSRILQLQENFDFAEYPKFAETARD